MIVSAMMFCEPSTYRDDRARDARGACSRAARARAAPGCRGTWTPSARR